MPIIRKGSNRADAGSDGNEEKEPAHGADGGRSSQRDVVTTNRRHATSWSPLTLDHSRYVVAILQGPDQSGKTHFAFTAPDPILILTFDPGNIRRGVGRHFTHKNIQMAEFELPKGLVKTSTLADVAHDEMNRFEDTINEAIRGEFFKSIIVDREDEVWELARYDEFEGNATSTKSKTHAGTYFTKLNSRYKAMFKQAHKHQKNLLLIDAVDVKYKNDKPTDEWKRVGFKHLGMGTQLVLEHSRDNYDNFSIQVISCRDDATKNGLRIDKPEMEKISQVLADQGNDWPVDQATGDFTWFKMEFSTVMAYLIGGKVSEWQ